MGWKELGKKKGPSLKPSDAMDSEKSRNVGTLLEKKNATRSSSLVEKKKEEEEKRGNNNNMKARTGGKRERTIVIIEEDCDDDSQNAFEENNNDEERENGRMAGEMKLDGRTPRHEEEEEKRERSNNNKKAKTGGGRGGEMKQQKLIVEKVRKEVWAKKVRSANEDAVKEDIFITFDSSDDTDSDCEITKVLPWLSIPENLRESPSVLIDYDEEIPKVDPGFSIEPISKDCLSQTYVMDLKIRRGKDDAEAELLELLESDENSVLVRRDKLNKFDKQAMAFVDRKTEQFFGYLPRRIAGLFANLVELEVLEISGVLKRSSDENEADENSGDEVKVQGFYVEVTFKMLSNMTITGEEIDTASIMKEKMQFAQRLNEEEFMNDDWAWQMTQLKIRDAILKSTDAASSLFDQSELKVLRSFLTITDSTKTLNANECGLLTTRFLMRKSAWINNHYNMSEEAVNMLVQHQIMFNLSSYDETKIKTDEALRHVFNVQLCLENSKKDEMIYMLDLLKDEVKFENTSWNKATKNDDLRDCLLMAHSMLDSEGKGSVWIECWKASKPIDSLFLSPVFRNAQKYAFFVVFQNNIRIEDIYKAVKGIYRFPNIAIDRKNNNNPLSIPWLTRKEMLEYFRTEEIMCTIAILEESIVNAPAYSIKDPESWNRILELSKEFVDEVISKCEKGVKDDMAWYDRNHDIEKFDARTNKVSICTFVVEVLQNKKKFKEAVKLLIALLSQPFGAKYRGHWYIRLYIDLNHSMKEGRDRDQLQQKLFDVCKCALEDSWVVWADRIELEEKMNAVAFRKNKPKAKVPANYIIPKKIAWNDEDFDNLHGVTLEKDFVTRKKNEQYVKNKIMDDDGKQKEYKGSNKFFFSKDLLYVDDQGMPLSTIDLTVVENEVEEEVELASVEEYSLKFYRRLGWTGIHAEISLWQVLLNLLCYDVTFCPVQDEYFTAWPCEYQLKPIDYSKPDWIWPRRQNIVKQTLLKIKQGLGARMIVENWAKWCVPSDPREFDYVGTYCPSVTEETAVVKARRADFNQHFCPGLARYVEIVKCFDADVLSRICLRWLINPNETLGYGGMPDLFLWNPVERKAMCVEVKSETDKIQFNQKACVGMLRSAGFESRFLRVKDFSKKRR